MSHYGTKAVAVRIAVVGCQQKAFVGAVPAVVVDPVAHLLALGVERRVTLAGVVTTLAGDGENATRDGSKTDAQFNQPQALAVDAADVIYVTEVGGYVIRRVSSTGAVTTVAGDGTAGHRDASDPLLARFYGLEGLAVDSASRYLYVSDGNRGDDDPYHRLRRVDL